MSSESVQRDNAWLLKHATNVYSQYGEDGVLEAALKLLPCRDQTCVEFGAWDGLHLSNTANLIRSHGFRGVFIEGDARKVSELDRNYRDFPNVTSFCRMVGWEKNDGLDSILQDTDVATDFDLLSIDIDGNDFYVWQSIEKYQPKLVVIEFNQTIPVEVEYCQPCDPNVNVGASISSLVNLGHRKGYELISILRNNLLFVRTEFYERFGIADNRPIILRQDFSDVTWLFFGMDGTVHLAGAKKIPWHDLRVTPSRIQPLPRFLRRFPPNYNAAEMFLARTLRWWRR